MYSIAAIPQKTYVIMIFSLAICLTVLLFPIIAIGSPTVLHEVHAQVGNTTQLATFRDNITGLTMQYPSTWQPLSEEYTGIIFGASLGTQGEEGSDNAILANLTRPILALFPKSPTGANLIIVEQVLPFPLSAESFMNSSLLSLNDDPNIEINNTAPVSVGDSRGFRVNLVDTANDVEMSQIYMTKGSRGFVIQFVEGQEEATEKYTRYKYNFKLHKGRIIEP